MEADIKELHTSLMAARHKYDEKVKLESQASSERIRALNELNAAQQAVDKWYVAEKERAARDSEWGRRRDPGVAV